MGSSDSYTIGITELHVERVTLDEDLIKSSTIAVKTLIVLRLLKCHKAGRVKQVEYNVWIALKKDKKLVKGFFWKIIF